MPNALPPLTVGRSLWAIDQEALSAIIALQQDGSAAALERIAGRTGTRAATFLIDDEELPEPEPTDTADDGIAVISLAGVITPRASLLSLLFGGEGGLDDFQRQFRAAVSDSKVKAIVLDVDSPGGLTDLVPETAALVREARGSKPIIAVANTMAASAAYWIACQADELVVTPSGQVGSIGTVIVHSDWSGANAQMGVTKTYITSEPFKADANPDQPLAFSAQIDLRQKVSDISAMFVNDVAQARGVSTDTVGTDYGRGRSLLAQRALSAGMVDRVASLEAVVAELRSSSPPRLSGTPTNPAASRPDNERSQMHENVLKALARHHGLDPETATEEQVNAAVLAAEESPEPGQADDEPKPGEGEGHDDEPEGDDDEPDLAASTVTLTAAQYAELKSGADDGRAARAALAKRDADEATAKAAADRDAVIQAAVTDGRLHKDDVETFRDAYDASPERTKARLEALSPGVVPALERVDLADQPATAALALPDGDLPEGLSLLSPTERAQRSA